MHGTGGEMELKELRKRIGEIDTKMAELFEERMKIVEEVARYKSERGLDIEDLEREKSLIFEKSSLVKDEDIRSLYVRYQQSMMDIAKRWQHQIINGVKIAYSAENPASKTAVEKTYADANFIECEKYRDAYVAVERGECDLAVLPLENSDRGETGKVYDMIFSGSLFVNAVHILESEGSTTRYAVLSRAESLPDANRGEGVIFVMFTVSDDIGGLAKAINTISAYDYNMRVLRSRPMKDLPWHYYFYAELEGKCDDESMERITTALRAACPSVKVAGRFRKEKGDFYKV